MAIKIDPNYGKAYCNKGNLSFNYFRGCILSPKIIEGSNTNV